MSSPRPRLTHLEPDRREPWIREELVSAPRDWSLGRGCVSGLLDPNGGTGAHGSVRLQLPVFDLEGTRYTCGVRTRSGRPGQAAVTNGGIPTSGQNLTREGRSVRERSVR
jgi:hypothetical protein